MGTGSNDIHSKLKKLQDLSATDKDVIEALQKKINGQKLDLENLQQKHQSLLRNYEGVSNYAANDKVEFTRLKNSKESAEKEVTDLKKRLEYLEAVNIELRP